MDSILEVKNIEKTYPNDGFKLNKINFNVPKGSIVGIIWENYYFEFNFRIKI